LTYPWKDNEFCHLLFRAKLVGGSATTSSESLKVGWFDEKSLPPFSDGHELRERQGFQMVKNSGVKPHFE
jgi:hypothetical protein